LLHLVRYVSALEALFDQITLDLIAARAELARRPPARGEDVPGIDNPVVLFGHPIEPLRTAPVTDQNAFVSPEELRRLVGTHSSGIVTANPRDGHHRYPDPAAPQPHPANPDDEAQREAATSTRHARLDINEVD